jgi:hypothetical protein
MTSSRLSRTPRLTSPPWELRFVRPPYADLELNHGPLARDSPGTLAILRLPEVDLTSPLHWVLRAKRETGPCPIILEVMAIRRPDGLLQSVRLWLWLARGLDLAADVLIQEPLRPHSRRGAGRS